MVVPIANVLGAGGTGDEEEPDGVSVVFPHMIMFCCSTRRATRHGVDSVRLVAESGRIFYRVV
jgi:hypothetical protein